MGRLQNILHWLWERSPVTKSEIANHFGLHIGIVNSQVNELLDWGIVVYGGFAESSGGRKARLVKLNPDLGHFAAVRISRDAIQSTITDINADVEKIYTDHLTHINSTQGLIEKTIEAIERLHTEADDRKIHINRIGISIAGLVDQAKGLSITFPRIPQWNNIELRKILEERFDKPIDLANDIHASTNAVRILYNKSSQAYMVFVQLGPGIGAGYIINGQVYCSPLKYSGELGHIVLDQDGPLCYCGQQGCLESLASDYAIIERIKTILSQGSQNSVLHELTTPENLNIQHILQGAAQKDRICYQALDLAGEYLGRGISNLINLLGPQIVYLDGTLLSDDQQIVLNAIKRIVYQNALNRLDTDFDIEVLNHQNVALRGAAYLSIERYLFESIFSKIIEK